MNKGQVFAAVASLARRPNTTVADLELFLSLTESKLNLLLRDHPRTKIVSSYTQPVGSTSALIPIPDDMASLVTLSVGPVVYPQYPSGSQAPVLGYIERGNCLEVFPTPVEGTVFALVYNAFPAPLVSDASTNWISKWFPMVYVYGMLAELGTATVHSRRSEWETVFDKQVAAVVAQGWNQNASTPPTTRKA